MKEFLKEDSGGAGGMTASISNCQLLRGEDPCYNFSTAVLRIVTGLVSREGEAAVVVVVLVQPTISNLHQLGQVHFSQRSYCSVTEDVAEIKKFSKILFVSELTSPPLEEVPHLAI